MNNPAIEMDKTNNIVSGNTPKNIKSNASQIGTSNDCCQKKQKRLSEESLERFALELIKGSNSSLQNTPKVSGTSEEQITKQTSTCQLENPASLVFVDVSSTLGNIGESTGECHNVQIIDSASKVVKSDSNLTHDNAKSDTSESTSESALSDTYKGESGNSINTEPNQNNSVVLAVNHEVQQQNNDFIENQHIIGLEAGEAVIDIRRAPYPVGHIECYLEIMRYLGVSSYRRYEYPQQSITWFILLNVFYWIYSTLAFTETLRKVKKAAMGVAVNGNLPGCVKFGFYMIQCFNRGFFISLITFATEKISVMLLLVRSMRTFERHYSPNKQFSLLALALAVSSFLLSVSTVFFSFSSFDNWSFQKAIAKRCFFIEESLFLWSAPNFESESQALFLTYYEPNLTSIHVAMAATDGVLDFSARLQGEIIRDILMLAPFVLLTGWSLLDKRIQPQLLIHPNKVDPVELEGSLHQYKALREATASVNNTLGAVFKFVIIQNLLLYAYLFEEVWDIQDVDMRIIHTAVDVFKASVTFYISLRIYWKNGNAKTWLRMLTTYNGPVDVENILGMSVQAALDALRDDPIGFGTDYFLINEAFLVGFFAAVSSIITFLVDQGH